MVLKYRFPNVKNYGDVNAIKWEERPNFEVLFGGAPCQDLSLAGKRKGLAGERSGLFYKFVEALKAKKPEYFVYLAEAYALPIVRHSQVKASRTCKA